MREIEAFYELKNSVLEHYLKRYPYFEGNWKSFSSQDIANLIEDVFEKTKSSVSEKWIYTHLKPETNERLPRKDMLDIFSKYVGKSGWDEYKHERSNLKGDATIAHDNVTPRNNKKWILVLMLVLVSSFLFWKFKSDGDDSKIIQLNEKYSNDSITSKTTKAFVIEDSVEKEIAIKESKIEVKKDAKVTLKSPFYKDKTIDLGKNPKVETIELQPNDYANILQGFIKSDIKDWQTRKTQLQMILDNNLEVIIMLKNNLGAEYFNKEEFSRKLIIPTPSLKQLKIVELKNTIDNKIIFIRLIQE